MESLSPSSRFFFFWRYAKKGEVESVIGVSEANLLFWLWMMMDDELISDEVSEKHKNGINPKQMVKERLTSQFTSFHPLLV